jgi:hypothetical protein
MRLICYETNSRASQGFFSPLCNYLNNKALRAKRDFSRAGNETANRDTIDED